jgi:hypothetical protein
MAAMFRDWLSAKFPDVPVAAGDLPLFGNISFSDVATGLLASYNQARSVSETDPNLPGAPLVAYSLRDVAATLAYGVTGTGNDQQGIPFIQNVMTMQVDSKKGAPTLRGQFAGPEFALVGDARQQFLSALENSVGTNPTCNNILNADAAYADDYCRALRDESRAKTALVFLSYRDQPPQPQFLVIWTGTITGDELQEQRDFAFTCSLGSNGLQSFQIVLRLEDPIAGSITGLQHAFAEARLTRDEYVGVHNFIHAVRIWDMRAGWLTPKGT